MISRRRILENVQWGVRTGAVFAGLYSLLVVGLAIARGSTHWGGYSLDLWQIIVLYFVCGTIAGALVGLMRPVTKSRLGAVAVGLLAAVPIAMALGIAFDGNPRGWGSEQWSTIKLLVLTIGPIGGWIRWSQTWGRVNANENPDGGGES